MPINSRSMLLAGLYAALPVLLYFLPRGAVQAATVCFFIFIMLFFCPAVYKLLHKFMRLYSSPKSLAKWWLVYTVLTLIFSAVLLFIYAVIGRVNNNYGGNYRLFYNALPFFGSLALCLLALILSVSFWGTGWLRRYMDVARYAAWGLSVVSFFVSYYILGSFEQVMYSHVFGLLGLFFAELLYVYQTSRTKYLSVFTRSAGYCFIRFSAYGAALFFAIMHFVVLW